MTLLVALLASAALPVHAQAPAKPAAHPSQDEEEAEDTVSEVVVTATRDRPLPGAVVGDIKPDIQLSPAEIQSYGVSSVADLLNELSPQITSNRGRGGEAPVVLLNGRRISGFGEIRDIPTEAIVRVDILPEEAGLAYGYTADQRVVNIVLRRRFRAVTTDVSGGGATQGGQAAGSAELNQIQIRGDNRLNLVLKAQASSSITEDERDVGGVSGGQPFDLTGNLTGAVRGGDIDPALSALVGRPVTVAGLPVTALNGQPLALGDLAATAGVANLSDVGQFRTLTPETRQVTGNAVLARTLPAGFRGTVTANFSASSSEALRGLPGASLTVPADNPFSPLGSDAVLNRYVTGFGPLRQTTEGWTGGLGGSLNKDLDKWRLSLTGTYDHSTSLTRSDVGVDISALQQAVNGGASPFAPWPGTLLAERGRNKAQSVSDGFTVQGVASGPAFDAPAGPVRTSFKVGEAASWLASDTLRSGIERDADLSRNTLSAQGSIDIPLASRKRDVLPFLGELSVNANAAVNDLSDYGTLTTVGFGANWRPVTGVSLIVSHTRDEGAPTMAQLGGPLVTTEAARVFDYATGRTVEVLRLDGGNAALTGDTRNVTKVGLTWKPFTARDLTLSANYVSSRIDNPISTFPAATTEIEAAFPDRFLRNAAGDLIQIDYRPVNFARSKVEDLRWGINYSRPFGPQPPPRRPGGGPRPGGAGPPAGDRPEGAAPDTTAPS
ncbi:MAG: TonB-dependent receptor plug domain-containing protein, partial [Alphaproteobacteria bacterium]|nr:TonB-dependent receptor plug domain-containing protein [Alphaproteobacteria bacterium]